MNTIQQLHIFSSPEDLRIFFIFSYCDRGWKKNTVRNYINSEKSNVLTMEFLYVLLQIPEIIRCKVAKSTGMLCQISVTLHRLDNECWLSPLYSSKVWSFHPYYKLESASTSSLVIDQVFSTRGTVETIRTLLVNNSVTRLVLTKYFRFITREQTELTDVWTHEIMLWFQMREEMYSVRCMIFTDVTR